MSETPCILNVTSNRHPCIFCQFLDLAENFTRNEIIPVAAEHDKSGEFPWGVIKKAHEVGLMNMHISPKYGGNESAVMAGMIMHGNLYKDFRGLW